MLVATTLRTARAEVVSFEGPTAYVGATRFASEPFTFQRGSSGMEQEGYKGYLIWGHAIAQQSDVLMPEQYAASGTITAGNKLVEASGVLGMFETEQQATAAGVSWARAWVDIHG